MPKRVLSGNRYSEIRKGCPPMADNVSMSVKVEGMDQLIRKIKTVENGKYVTLALKTGGERVKDVAGKYPPASDANNPSNQRWYERNYGTKWRTKDGSVKGKKTSE